MRLKWKFDLVCLEIVLILGQDRCMVCAERTIGLQIIVDTLDGILGDMGHVESHFGLHGDSVSVGARQVHGLRWMYYRHTNCFGRTRWNS